MDEDYRPVPRRDVVFDVEQGLQEARKLWPRERVYGDYNPLRSVAEAVIEHLELCQIRFFRPPPDRGHGTPVNAKMAALFTDFIDHRGWYTNPGA